MPAAPMAGGPASLAISLLLLLGLALVAAGQYVILLNEPAARQLTQLVPAGIVRGLLVLLLGSMLAAIAVGQPPVAADESIEPRPLSSCARLRRWGYALSALAGVSAALTILLLVREVNGRTAAWLATAGTGLVATLVFDRIRGTRIGNPFPQRWEWAALTCLAGLSLFLVAHDLTHWRWSGTPDETHFFTVARSIAEGRHRPFPLSQNGVFDFQPVLSSYYQALFMKVFGMNIFGWRVSSAAAFALSVPLVYVAARELWNWRAGLFAAAFFGCAQLPVGFSHFGYNNTQVYPVVVGALAALLWGTRRRSLAGYYLTGWIAGLGFFTYYVALVGVPLVVLLGWSGGRLSLRRGRRGEVLALALPILLCALPALASPGATAAHVHRLTVGSEPVLRRATADGSLAAIATWAGPVTRVARHWLLSILHPLWFREPHHFQSNPVVDPVSGALAAIGLWLGLWAALRRSRDGFLVPGYVVAAFVAGAITPHHRPPLTRLLVLAPLTAMLSAVALDQLVRFAVTVTRRRAVGWSIIGALLAAAAAWNVSALHDSVYRVYRGYGDGTTSELIRLAQQLPDDYRIVYVQRPETYMQDVDSVAAQYRLESRFTYLRPNDQKTAPALATLAPPFFAAYSLIDVEQKRAVEQAVLQRFPGARWRDSDPGQMWSLRYVCVPERVILP